MLHMSVDFRLMQVDVLDGDAVRALGEVELVVRVSTTARAVPIIGTGPSFPDCTVHIEERAILTASGSLGQNDLSLCHIVISFSCYLSFSYYKDSAFF